MKEVLEKIIEKLEEYRDKNLVEHDSEQSQHCKDVGDCGMRDCALCVFDKAIEIVKREAEECKPGHFGCNSNGQHEKCSSCCDYDCNVMNRTWFGEDELDNNGWIPCSERMPEFPEEIDGDECPNFNVTIKGADQVTTLKCASDGTWFDDLGYTYDVIAWQPLPAPYQPKGE